MNFSGRTPSLEMVRKCFMVSPQERHTMVGPLAGTKGDRPTAQGGWYGMCVSTESGGSATGFSATNAWHGAVVGDDAYVRLIRTVARLSFRQLQLAALTPTSSLGGGNASILVQRYDAAS